MNGEGHDRDPRDLRPGRGAALTADPSIMVVDLVRRAAAALDSMWQESLLAGDSEAGMRLGEASHCVHRALIALDSRSPAQHSRPLSSAATCCVASHSSGDPVTRCRSPGAPPRLRR